MAQGRIGRIVMGKLAPGTLLIPGIERLCEEAEISHAVVQCALGSLQSACFHVSVRIPEKKIGAGPGDEIRIEALWS